MRRLAALALAALIVQGCDDDDPVRPGPSRSSRTLSVAPDGSGEYPTIQSAIDASKDGDTISLNNGRYQGDGNRDLDFGGRSILLTSRSGISVLCVIDCDGTEEEPHGAIWFHSQELDARVENLTIEDSYGPGVLCEGGSSPSFTNVVFIRNNGTAAYCRSPSIAGVSFVDCKFRNNQGSSLSCVDTSEVFVAWCLFEDNFAGYAGASIADTSSRVFVQDCVFRRNQSGYSGAAIVSHKASWGGRPEVIVKDCYFIANVGGYHGGALDFSQTDFTLENSYFSANNGGAFWCGFESAGTIAGCVFYGNRGTRGAAINVGGDASVTMDAGIIAWNTGSAGLLCDQTFPPARLDLTCTDIYTNEGGDWVGCIADLDSIANNTSVDPMFCDAASNDFFLHPESPLRSLPCSPLGGWPVGCITRR